MSAERAWLPYGDRTPADTVAAQRGDPHTPLERHRNLIAAARSLPSLRNGDLEWLDPDGPVISYRCGDCLVLVNLSDDRRQAKLPTGQWACAYSTRVDYFHDTKAAIWELEPREAVIIRRAERRHEEGPR